MEENGWKVQFSLKLGPHMLNLRAEDWSTLIPLIQQTAENFDLLKTTAKLCEPGPPDARYPVADIRATPPVAATTPTTPAPAMGQPGEVITTVTGVVPKVGTEGKPYSQLIFGTGQKVNVFDSQHVTVAGTALAQNRRVAVLFVQKGQYTNLGSIRLLGAV